MRILQVGSIPPEVGGETFGGVATHVWDLSRHLAERGHEVAILADNLHNPAEIPLIKDKIKLYGLFKASVKKLLPSVFRNITTLYKLKKHFQNLIEIRALINKFYYYQYGLENFRPDIIHIHHIEERFPFIYYSCMNCEIPIITTIHSFSSIKFNNSLQREKYRKLIETNLGLAHYLILAYKFIEEEFKEFFPSYQGEYWVVSNPINTNNYYQIDRTESRKRTGLPENAHIILFVGELIKLKGVYTILKAAPLIKESISNFIIAMAGEGSEAKKINEYIHNNNLENYIKLTGLKPRSELIHYYNSADILVVPQFARGLAIVYLEAMLCGIPVIAPEGINEAIPSSDYGLQVPPGNVNALVQTIEFGLKKRWDREKIVRHANTFSWQKRIVEYEKIYERLVCKG